MKTLLSDPGAREFLKSTANGGVVLQSDLTSYNQVTEVRRVSCPCCGEAIEIEEETESFECPRTGNIHSIDEVNTEERVYRRNFSSSDINELFDDIKYVESELSRVELSDLRPHFVVSPFFDFENEFRMMEERPGTVFVDWEVFQELCSEERNMDDLRERRKDLYTDIIDFSQLSGEEFEQLCVKLFEVEGFEDISSAGSGNDMDRDITFWKDGDKWICQCKNHAESGDNVTKSELNIDLALATHDADSYMVLSTTDVASSLITQLENLDDDDRFGGADWWKYEHLERRLLSNKEVLWHFFVKERYNSFVFSELADIAAD